MVWIWIPIVAILAGVASDYIKMRSKQSELGTDSGTFKKEIDALRAELETQKASYEQRLANLETIVTSQSWDALPESLPSPKSNETLNPDLRLPDLDLPESISSTQKTKLLAEKLQ